MEILGKDYDLVTLDYESFYGTGCSLSLQSMNTFSYIAHPDFSIHGVGIKINQADTEWVEPERLVEFQYDVFEHTGRPIALLAHNCLTGDHEVKTPQGWVRLDQFHGGEVMQWDENTTALSYANAVPVKNTYRGKMLAWDTNYHQGVYTPEHRMFYSTPARKDWRVSTSEGVASKSPNNTYIPTGGVFECAADDELAITSLEARLLEAIRADANICTPSAARFKLKKQRKVERLLHLVKRLGIPHRVWEADGITNVYLKSCPFTKMAAQLFGTNGEKALGEWVYRLSLYARRAWLEEVQHWDGHKADEGDTATAIHSAKQNDVAYLAEMAAITGGCGTIFPPTANARSEWNNDDSVLYRASLRSKERVKLVERPKEIDHDGFVYCVNVPTGAFLVRRNGRMWVTGNCPFDAYILHHFWDLHPDLYLDTLAMSRGMFPGRKHGLKELAERLWPDDPTMRKGEELENFRNVTTEQLYADPNLIKAMMKYGVQDVDLTHAAFLKMLPYYPEDELELIHLTTQMTCEPMFVLDKPLISAARDQWIAERQAIIDAAPVAESTLASNAKFEKALESRGVAIIHKADLKTGKMKPALGKADLGFQQMKAAHPDLETLFDGRAAAKSVGQIRRAERFLETAEICGGLMPMPLKYYSALTGRYGGGELLNVQNMNRGSALRKSLCAPPGYKVVVVDSSNIEARMLAWLAGQEELLEVFRSGGDVYSHFATLLYDFEVNKNDHPHERFIGKVCIAEGSLVLTPRGLVPIEKIRTADKVWDGVEWVDHDGVIYQGHKEVIEYDGLLATPDHEVYTTGSPDPIQLGSAALRMDRLVEAGVGRQAVRVSDDYLPAHRPSEGLPQSFSPMHGLWHGERNQLRQPNTRQNQWVPKLLPTAIDFISRTREAIRCVNSAMQFANESGLQTLRRSRNMLQLYLSGRVHPVCGGELAAPRLSGFGDRPDQQRRALRAWEPATSNPLGAKSQQSEHAPHRVAGSNDTPTRVSIPLQLQPHVPVYEARDDGRADHRTGVAVGAGETQGLESAPRKAHVYDIANAGPNRRFTVSGKLVANCVLGLGYGQGHARFRENMAAGMLGGPPVLYSEPEARDVVGTYRTVNYKIVAYWKEAQQAITDMYMGHEYDWGPLRVARNALIMPNGMALQYPGLRPDDEGGFEYHNGTYWTRLYGPKLVENIVQALSRIVLFDQMLESNRHVTQHDGRVVLNVHDEIIAIVPDEYAEADFAHMIEIMRKAPTWCHDLPLDGEGGFDNSYSK